MYRVVIPETENPQEAESVYRVGLCGMLRLIRVDTLRRDNNVGFLAGRLDPIIDLNPFPHTTNLQQTSLKMSSQNYGKSLLL